LWKIGKAGEIWKVGEIGKAWANRECKKNRKVCFPDITIVIIVKILSIKYGYPK
jgi:hypothetical protein